MARVLKPAEKGWESIEPLSLIGSLCITAAGGSRLDGEKRGGGCLNLEKCLFLQTLQIWQKNSGTNSKNIINARYSQS